MKPKFYTPLRRVLVSFALTSFLLAGTFSVSARVDAQNGTIRVAVKTGVELTPAIVNELSQYGQVGHRMWKLNLVDMRVSPDNVSKLQALPIVQYVEQEEATFAIPIETAAVSDFSNGFSTWDLDMINVTDSATGTRAVDFDGEGVYVAVLDSGLASNWRDYFPEERIDTIRATAFTGGANERSPWDDRGHAAVTDRRWEKDTNGHGTHVTSTLVGYHLFLEDPPVVADINGVAPKATIIPIKVINQNGFGSNLDIVAALYYVGDLRKSGDVKSPIVVNMSLGTLRPAQSLEDAIDFAIEQGVIVVVAAGNEGDQGMTWPGAYPQVISAAATGWKQAWMVPGDPNPNPFFLVQDVPEEPASSAESFIAFFSSRQKDGQELDLAAPGMWVFGPTHEHGPKSPPFSSSRLPIGFNFLFGTSMASPHVAGAAALLMEKNPNLTQSEVETKLKETAIPILPGTYLDPILGIESVWGAGSSEQGSGLLQVDKALNAI